MYGKILHIVKANKIAGAEAYVFNLINSLNKEGYKVYLINLREINRKSHEKFDKKIDNLKKNGVQVDQIFIKNKLDISSILKIRRVIEHIAPNIVHTHMPTADLFGAIAAKTLGKRVISTRHHDYSHSWIQTLKFVMYYSFANLFHDRTIAVSNALKKLMHRYELLTIGKVSVIYHGSTGAFKDKGKSREVILKEFNLSKSSIVIGTVGRLIGLKGHKYAIQAFEKIIQKYKNVYWVFIGDGPEYNNLVSLVKKNGLENRVLFLGYRDDIPTLMSAIDILVHPTTAESFGLVLLEAMMQETPIIASNVGAIPEIVIDGETGFIIPSKNTDALKNTLDKAISNRKQLNIMGRNGRKRFEEEFRLEIMSSSTVNLYKKIIVD